MNNDSDFDRFCGDLEELKGQVALYRTRSGLTDKIMVAVRYDKKRRLTARLRRIVRPLAVASVVLLAWFFFLTPIGLAISGQTTFASNPSRL